LQVNRNSSSAGCLFCNKYLSIEINPAVHHIQRFLPNRFTVDIENDSVTKHTEMDLVPLVVKDLRFLPRQSLELSVVV
jgi:hypothetical protein